MRIFSTARQSGQSAVIGWSSAGTVILLLIISVGVVLAWRYKARNKFQYEISTQPTPDRLNDELEALEDDTPDLPDHTPNRPGSFKSYKKPINQTDDPTYVNHVNIMDNIEKPGPERSSGGIDTQDNAVLNVHGHVSNRLDSVDDYEVPITGTDDDPTYENQYNIMDGIMEPEYDYIGAEENYITIVGNDSNSKDDDTEDYMEPTLRDPSDMENVSVQDDTIYMNV